MQLPSESKAKGKVVPMRNEAPHHKGVLGEWRCGGIALYILWPWH